MSQFPDVSFDGLYGDAIMDHYRNPRHRSPLTEADVEAHEYNPFCGDEVTLRVKLDDAGRVAQVNSHSQGCSIIQASASMMAVVMEGKTLEELGELSRLFRDFMQGKSMPELSVKQLEDLAALQVVRQFPVRIKCALLPWTALEEGIAGFRRES
ncbi:MAG: Fe-S cluster assembly sulfur transfer protein SufU [Dehalococcoidia bacterium]